MERGKVMSALPIDLGFGSPDPLSQLPQEQALPPDQGLGLGLDDYTADLSFTDGEVIALSQEDEARILYYCENALNQADQAMSVAKAEAAKDRGLYKLIDRTPAYDGAPAITTPLTREKVDGLLSHIVEAIDLEPLFSLRAETQKDMKGAAVGQQYLNREIKFGDNRRSIVIGCTREAAQVGTAFPWISFTTSQDGELFQQIEVVRLENMYVYPLDGVNTLQHCFVGRRQKEPYHLVESKARAGLLSLERVERLKNTYSSPKPITDTAENSGGEPANFGPEAELHPIEYYEMYIRFAPKGEPSQLFNVVFDRMQKQILRCVINPFHLAFDSPPVQNLRFMSEESYVLGMSLPRVLRGLQEMKDNSANARIAYNGIAASPPFLYNQQNRKLSQALQQGLIPGLGIPNDGPPKNEDVKVLQFPHPNLTFEDMQIADAWADQATFNDEAASGVTGSTRQTAYEYGAKLQIGTQKLRLSLRDYASDAARLGEMIRANQVAYKIRPRGIVDVSNSSEMGKHLAYQDIPKEQLYAEIGMAVQILTLQGEMADFDLMQFMREMGSYITEDGIPGAANPNLSVELTGKKVISDRISESQMYESFAMYLNLLPFASQDHRVWHFLKRVAETKGMFDWKELIGDDPAIYMEAEKLAQTLGGFQQIIERSTRF
jgi:hypothetical protein